MNEELKELLGIKPADFIFYIAAAAVAWMYFTQNTTLDTILSVVAIILCVISCLMGIRPHPLLSGASNMIKLVSYPAGLIAVFACIYLNFTRWNVH